MPASGCGAGGLAGWFCVPDPEEDEGDLGGLGGGGLCGWCCVPDAVDEGVWGRLAVSDPFSSSSPDEPDEDDAVGFVDGVEEEAPDALPDGAGRVDEDAEVEGFEGSCFWLAEGGVADLALLAEVDDLALLAEVDDLSASHLAQDARASLPHFDCAASRSFFSAKDAAVAEQALYAIFTYS